MKATNKQIGGSHYKDMPIQPVEFIHKNGIPYIEGSVIKYVSRWRNKGGVEDLKKARHCLDMLIEMEGPQDTKGVAKPEPPWPERYEVGMRFRRRDGATCRCVFTTNRLGFITTPSGGMPCKGSDENVNIYEHGKFAAGHSSIDSATTLVEYLGKD